MKKSVKIITLVLSLALVLGVAIGFSVSAETTEPTAPVVLKKNAKTNGNFCLMFALDPASCGDTITVEAYNTVTKDAENAADALIESFTVNKANVLRNDQNIDLDGDGNNDEIVMIETNEGVEAANIADTWHVYFTSNGQTTHVEYSVKDYAFERLYADFTILENDSSTKAYRQKQFYLSILEIGSTAQNLLVNWDKNTNAPVATPERLAKEYSYASIQGGTFNDGLTGSYVEKDDTLTLTQSADNTEASWKVYTFDTNGNPVGDPATVEITDGSATVTVAGNTVIVPGWAEGLTPGKYFADLGDSAFTFDDVTTLSALGMTSNTNAFGHATTLKYGSWAFVNYEGRGKILQLTKDGVTQTSKSRYWVPVVDKANGEGNCVVMEFDFMATGKKDGTSETVTKDGVVWTSYNSIVPNLLSGLASDSPTDGILFDKFSLYTVDNNADDSADFMHIGKINSYSENKVIKFGEWINVCVEVYDTDGTNGYYKVFLNGELIVAGTQASNVKVSDAKSMLFNIQDSFRPCEVNIDNMFVGIISKEYSKWGK